jgi:integrase
MHPMPPLRKAVPSYLLHKQTGRARAVWTDETGTRREKLLPGAFNSSESRAAHARLINEQAVGGTVAVQSAPTVAEVLEKYLLHAERHYRGPNGRTTSTYRGFKRIVRATRLLYATLRADQFGPLAMKAVRNTWIVSGLARSEVNRRAKMLRRIFKWAAEEELIPASVPVSLSMVSGLQKGRTTARESERVLPVAEADVNATLPYLKPHARALILFMRHTGCRPGEACSLRPCDITTTANVWQYRPAHHKNTHRDRERVIAIGPLAQALLTSMMPDDPASYFFSPQNDVRHFHDERRERRATPLYESHIRHIASKRVATPKRAPAEFYTSASIGAAVRRAINAANREREQSRVEHGPNLLPIPHWHPNQIRHSHGTKVRHRYGLEAAQYVLGHARADVTQIYAEKNFDVAAEIAMQIG